MQGLENLGSTCAINSLIQIICKNNYLRNAILESNPEINTISYELKEILDLMHNKGHSISPKKFISYFYKIFEGIFIHGEQNDVGEIWLFLFEKISSELSIDNNITLSDIELSKNILYTNTELANNKDFIQKCNYIINRLNNNKISKLFDAGQGIFINIIKCKKCDNVLCNFETFTSIPLDIIENYEDIPGAAPSVTKLLRHFLKEQEHCDDWKCEKCNEKTEYTKSIKMWKMPKVLIFIIKRFININTKNTSPINVNKALCIKNGSILSDIDNDYNYNLSSFALHYGNLSGGHYCAICNIVENNEIKHVLYDDLNMTPIIDEKYKNFLNNNKDGYMIVYSLEE